MNALYGMAYGKVVLTGAEPVSFDKANIPISPAINILPDVNNVVNQLEKILSSPSSISTIARQSTEYIRKYHASEIIASKYIKAWHDA